MVFAVITMMAEHFWTDGYNMQGTPSSRSKSLKDQIGKVRVYGDDIICPSTQALAVAELLEAFGLRVNQHKSFWRGFFRESCGKEYFKGLDVTHVKVRSVLPDRQQSEAERASALVKTSALRNHLYEYGYWQTCSWLDSIVEGFIPYPAVGADSPAIGRLSSLGYEAQRWDDDLQLPLVKAAVVNVKSPSSPLDGTGALMKCLVKQSEFPNPDSEHLLRAGRPSVLRIKLRWVRSY
jgi:hypothetical protein